jgi:Pla-1/cef family extracellular lipase
MRKLVLGTSIAALVGLAGCSGETIEDLQTEATSARPASRIMFDPSNGVLPVPTDLLFALAGQTQDGTLELPAEVASRAANNGMPDYSDPGIALGAQDGWSTQAAFAISTSHPAGVTLDAASVGSPGSVRIFRGAIGGDLKDPDCSAASPLTGCKIYEELTYGVDFAAQASGNNINIIPLKAFAGATSYYVVLTTGLKASDGEALKGSTTYNLVRQPISTMPLATASQLALQGLVNSYEAVIVSQGAVDADSIIYSSTFTTQTTNDIFNTIKGLQIGGFAQAFGAALAANGGDQSAAAATAAAQLPVILVDATSPLSAYEVVAPIFLGAQTFGGLQAIGLGTCSGLTAAAVNPASPLNDTAAPLFAQFGVLCSAQVTQGKINLPYYLSTTEPLTDSWQAACTNGLALRGIGAEGIGGLIAAGAVGPANALCQAASGGTLFDLDISSLPIIDDRHLTRYSPIPLPKGSNADGSETLSVQISVPDLNFITTLAAINPAVTVPTKPAAGWPVVILSHGIIGKKEQMLAVSGVLSLAGFATVAIDQPLHGERGFVLADDTVINASDGMGGSTTHYFNIANLLSSRDNNRQGIADIMGLRLGLNALVDPSGTIDIDVSSVYLAGQSLGSIIGHSAVAMANESLAQVSPALASFDAMYAFKGVGLSVPGGGQAGFLLESGGFGNLLKGSLFAASSTDFQAFLGQFAAQNGLTVTAAIPDAYEVFSSGFNEEQQASAAALFAQFAFAAQTVLDAGDPNTYAAILGAQDTPVYIAEVVGGGINDDGSTGLSDQIIPNFVPPLSGTTPLARLIGLPLVSSTSPGNGHVRFNAGGHVSLIVPTPSAATTVEMQSQLASFFATAQSGSPTVVVTNTSVVVN